MSTPSWKPHYLSGPEAPPASDFDRAVARDLSASDEEVEETARFMRAVSARRRGEQSGEES